MVAASNSYFQDADEASQEAPAAQPAVTTGPRTLDGRPAPAAAASSGGSSRPQQKKKGVATLGTLGGSSQHHHDDDDSGDDDDEDDNNRGNLFAGEKSLASLSRTRIKMVDRGRLLAIYLPRPKRESLARTCMHSTLTAGQQQRTTRGRVRGKRFGTGEFPRHRHDFGRRRDREP